MKASFTMYTIGVDLGGTNIAVGIVDENQKIIEKGSVPTKADRDGELIIKDMAELAARLLDKNHIPLSEVAYAGIATPGVANNDDGLVEYATDQFEENTKKIEELIRQREQNIGLSGDLKGLIGVAEAQEKGWKEEGTGPLQNSA